MNKQLFYITFGKFLRELISKSKENSSFNYYYMNNGSTIIIKKMNRL